MGLLFLLLLTYASLGADAAVVVVDDEWARKLEADLFHPRQLSPQVRRMDGEVDVDEVEDTGEEEVEEMEENDVLEGTERKAESDDAGKMDPAESVLMPAGWRRIRNRIRVRIRSPFRKPRRICFPYCPRIPRRPDTWNE